MRFLGYQLTMFFLRALALLPATVLYRFSDLLYLFLRFLIRYRRSVILKNIGIAFPAMEYKDRRKLMGQYYLHLSDLIIENGVMPFFGEQRIQRMFQPKNLELFEPIYKENRHVILLTGHYGNWEWSSPLALRLKHRILAVYRPLRNQRFDSAYRKARTKFGAEAVNMAAIGRALFEYTQDEIPALAGMVGDQRPIWQQANFWTPFFGRPTPFFTGSEKLARKFNAAVIFMQVQKLARGRYQAHFSLITDHPESLQEGAITAEFAERLEKQVKQEPAYWLWSHDRWRYSKEQWFERKQQAAQRK